MGPGRLDILNELRLHQFFARFAPARDAVEGVLGVASGPGFGGDDPLAPYRGDPEERTVAVRGGRPAVLKPAGSPAQRGQPGDLWLAWAERPGLVVLLSGRLPAEELLAVAEGLRERSPGPGFEAGHLPAGYEALFEQPSTYSLGTSGWMFRYASPDGGRSLELWVAERSEEPPEAKLQREGARIVDVRGHRAVAWGQHNLTWAERPGTVVSLQATGLPPDEVLRVARGLAEVGEARWRELFRQGAPPGAVPDPEIPPLATARPAGPPPEHRTIEYRGLRVSFPATWTVIDLEENPGGGCVRTDATITLGTSEALGRCPPRPEGSWVWLRPLSGEAAAAARACHPGFVDDVAICQAMAVDGTETLFYEGLDVVRTNRHGDGPATPNDVGIRHADPGRPEAAGADRYALDQGLDRASEFVRSHYGGDCERQWSLAASELRAGRTREGFVADCRRDVPPVAGQLGAAGFGEAGPPSAGGGSAGIASVEVRLDDGRVVYHEVRLVHRFDLEERRGRWEVTKLGDPLDSDPLSRPADAPPAVGLPPAPPVTAAGPGA